MVCRLCSDRFVYNFDRKNIARANKLIFKVVLYYVTFEFACRIALKHKKDTGFQVKHSKTGEI